MTLRIKKTNGIFYLEGNVNAKSAAFLKQQLESIVENVKNVILNINGVNEIDNNGLEVFKEMYLNALRYNRAFLITGHGCGSIYDEFKFDDAA